MRLLFLCVSLAAPSLASALEVDVRFGGLGRTYEVAPGAALDDTWSQIGLLELPNGGRVRAPDVNVHIEVRDAGDGYDVTVRLDEVTRGVARTVCAPTLHVAKDHVEGRFAVGRDVPEFSTLADGTIAVRQLTYYDTEVLVRDTPAASPIAPLGDVAFTDIASAQCRTASMVVVSKGHQSVTEVCELPDGRTWTKRIDVRRGRHGWAHVTPANP